MNKKKILIIDDEAVIRKYLLRILGPLPYELSTAEDLKTAFNQIESESFDLVISDLRLPDGNGEEAVIRFKEKYPDKPVIVITGSLSPEDRLERLERFGPIPCLFKPFERQAMLDAVQNVFKQQSGGTK